MARLSAMTVRSSPLEQPPAASNLDSGEVTRFEQISREWWDSAGKFRPLHQIGPARIAFIRDALGEHFRPEPSPLRPLKGLRLLDVGCGGGLVSEPLARLGANVTGIDPGLENIRAAHAHAQPQSLSIDYRQATVETLVSAGETFDAVVCLEVVEHVPDVGRFVAECSALVRPGGMAIFSTINRTLKSYALAIVGAEYVLGWLPRGTHRWDRFVTPSELSDHLAAAGVHPIRTAGIVYDPLTDTWHASSDNGVNYMLAAAKPV